MTTLGDLKKGEKGIVKALRESEHTQRMREIGILVGEELEVAHEAPFSRDPITVIIRGTQFALRREEARVVELESTHV